MNDTVNPLIDYFNRKLPLTQEEQELVARFFKPLHYPRRSLVLREGEVTRHFYFVVQGCLKLYKLDDHATEHILQFATEEHWTINIESFSAQTPSQLCIETIEDTQLLCITLADLRMLCGRQALRAMHSSR